MANSDLRKRSIKAGAIQGFFGQKNRNTKRRNDMADRVAELRQTQELERSKTQYEASVARTTKRRESEAGIVAANGVDAEGNFNDQGFQLAASLSVPDWKNKSDIFKENTIRNMSGNGAVNATSWLDQYHGTKVKSAAAFSDQMGGKSPFPTVQKTTNAMSDQVKEIHGGPTITTKSTTTKATEQGETAQGNQGETQGTPTVTANKSTGYWGYSRSFKTATSVTPDGVVTTKTYDDDGSTEVVPVMYNGKQLQSMENLPTVSLKQTDAGLMQISSPKDGSAPTGILILGADGKPIRGEHGLQQTTGTWTDSSGTTIKSVVFDSMAKGGQAYYSINPDGTKDYDVKKEGLTAEQSRVQKASDQDEFFITSTKAYVKSDQILEEYVASDFGTQGMLNVLSDNIGSYLNFWDTVESSGTFKAEALAAIGVDNQEDAKAAVNAHIRANLKANLTRGWSEAEISEGREELEALLIKASLNSQVLSLTYLAAKTYKGAGSKLTTDDLKRIDGLISLGDGKTQFIGGVTQLRHEMYVEAKQKQASIIARSHPDLADRIEHTRFVRPKEGNRSAGFFSLLDNPSSAEGVPIAVFVDANTAQARSLTMEQYGALVTKYEDVVAPMSVTEGSSRGKDRR